MMRKIAAVPGFIIVSPFVVAWIILAYLRGGRS